MVDVVSVGRLIVGHGSDRRVIPAGERFDTRSLKIDDREVDQMMRRGTLRTPRDDVRRQAAVAGPPQPVEEGRSGDAGNARSPGVQAQLAEDDATGDVSGAAGDGGTGETAPRTAATDAAARTGGGRRGKTSDLDL